MTAKRIHITAKTWQCDNANFQFPEEAFIAGRKNYGIAFSGGGNRSASLTIGYLRKLNELRVNDQKVIDNVKYISCVSGGAWASIPYTFLDKTIPDETFLGDYYPPDLLSCDNIERVDKLSFASVISETRLADDVLHSLLKNDERFANILSNMYLKSFLLGNTQKFFTLSDDMVTDIISRDGNKELDRSNFNYVQKNRPYLIAGGILSRSIGKNIKRYPFEMTPIYVGVPVLYKKAGSLHEFDLGGGYVESFGFDSDSPDEGNFPTGTVRLRIKYKPNVFSLADVMATTGAAPAEHLSRYFINIGFPEFKYWSPQKNQKAKEYPFADMGLLDNSGIMPLLRRKVEKIILFINTDSDLVTPDRHTHESVSPMIKSLFVKLENQWGIKDYKDNIVLEGGVDAFNELENEFIQLKKDGKPVVVQKAYTTLNNTLFGINAGHKLEIIWVHNTFVNEWYEKLKDPCIKSFIAEQQSKKNFPNYSTFFTDFPKIIDLDLKQANLMTQLASYVIDSNSKLFSNFLT